MPIYEYQCEACAHRMETIQKMSDAPLVECPACGRPALRKLVSAAGFQLKGSGWYVTDFKNKGGTSAPAEASSSKAGAAEAATKSDGGSETGGQAAAPVSSTGKADTASS